MSNIGVPELLVIILVILVVVVLFTLLPYWFIFRKASFHPALSLLMIVPIVSVAMLFFLAFSEWPALKKGNGAHEA